MLNRRKFLTGLITAAAVAAAGPKILAAIAPKAERTYLVQIIGGHSGARKKALIETRMHVGDIFLFAAKGGVPLTVEHILIDGKPHIDWSVPSCVAFRLLPEAVA